MKLKEYPAFFRYIFAVLLTPLFAAISSLFLIIKSLFQKFWLFFVKNLFFDAASPSCRSEFGFFLKKPEKSCFSNIPLPFPKIRDFSCSWFYMNTNFFVTTY